MHGNPPMTRAYHGRILPGELRRTLLGAALLGIAPAGAFAFTATLNTASPKAVYLQVGVGGFSNPYSAGGQPGNNAAVNTVSLAVPAGALGNGIPQTMTTNSTASRSNWDGYAFCNVPGQIYIGGFYRTAGGATAAAQVSAIVPAALVDASGDTIPFATIQWSASGNGDSGAEVFPSGGFAGGAVQHVGSMAGNTWNESCWTFSYRNGSIPPGGTFTGTVLYTLASP
jgi:hypothetical protein